MHQRTSGFTLIETLVALFVLSVALAGAFALISFNTSNANFIKNSFIASSLTQEGMELVRNLRDTDWFAGNEFGSFGNAGGPVPDGTYCVQWNSTELAGSCDPKLFHDSQQLYSHDSAGVGTVFSRSVNIRKVGASPTAEIVVMVQVSWRERTGTKQVNAEEHLYNWY
ncbi:MAG: prepilin-type N-terminal cleavage/methylation domain-containing protein [Patescibacteria group bacterium]